MQLIALAQAASRPPPHAFDTHITPHAGRITHAAERYEIAPADCIAPARVREIHRECLTELEDRWGAEYRVFRR